MSSDISKTGLIEIQNQIMKYSFKLKECMKILLVYAKDFKRPQRFVTLDEELCALICEQ